MRFILTRWHIFPVFLWAALLFFVSALPQTSIPSVGIKFEDLIAHACVYSVLGYLICLALFHKRIAVSSGLLWLACTIGVLYGITDEVHQYFIPSRFSSVSDAVADAVGIIIGVRLYKIYPSFRWKLRRKASMVSQ